MISHITKALLTLTVALVLSMPQITVAANPTVIVEKPTALAMTGDLVLARPLLLAMTVVGTAVFLVSLPFSLLGGNSLESANTLVVQPAKTTFVRCLGCSNSGYKKEVKESEEDQEEE